MKRRSLKQDKLARVYDTEIHPIWAERFGRMLLAEAKVPPKGLVLNVACGTGYPALDLLERMEAGRIIAIDSSSALLDVAREKAGDLSGKRIFFRTEGEKETLSFDDDVYDLTFSNIGLGELALSPQDALAELARVTAPGGQVLVSLPLRGTWSEFLDIYREVLTKQDRHETLERLNQYEADIPEPDVAIKWMDDAGLEQVDLVVDEFSLLFKSSREFFFAPVIEFGPLREWKQLAGKGQEMQDIFWFIKEAIDAYFGGRAFAVTVVAGCLSGIKRQPSEGDEEAAARETAEGEGRDEPPSAVLRAELADEAEPAGLARGPLFEPETEAESDPEPGPASETGSDRAADDEPAPDPLAPPPDTPGPDEPVDVKAQDSLDVMVSRPRYGESSMPLLHTDEVSIHELDDDDLEVVEEEPVEDEDLIDPELTDPGGPELMAAGVSDAAGEGSPGGAGALVDPDLSGDPSESDVDAPIDQDPLEDIDSLEDEADTNVRNVTDLPDHLRRAIKDQTQDEDGEGKD